METANAVAVEGLRKDFGPVRALDGVDMSVGRGTVYGLLGPNGAGKSTLIDVLLGLTTPTEGRALVFGTSVTADPRTVRDRIGVLPQDYGLYSGLSGRENLRLLQRLKSADGDLDRLLDTVGLDDEAVERPVEGYSTGMRQRLVFAAALAGDPDLLILDEPMSGLDPEGVVLVRELVRERAEAGTTVFFSSHRLAEVEALCDRAAILADGEVVSVEDVDALEQRVGGNKQLRLTTERPADEDTLDRLRSIDGVAAVERDGCALSVACTEPAAKADVIEHANRGCSVVDFEIVETGLEEVFAETVARDRSGSADGSRPTLEADRNPKLDGERAE
ncbi:ABC transporter ATP-binding protein [Halosimplex sp. J119]